MDTIAGKIIGNINIIVYETPEGYKFFKLNTDNENISPVLDVIEDTLINY